MIPYARHRQMMTVSMVNDVERALGLPLSQAGQRMAPLWDAIAHETGLPDSEALQRSMDGPGIETLPHWVWNRAVDIANSR